MAANLKSWLPVPSDSISNSPVELLDPKNGGLAAGTAFLSCLEAEIYVLPIYWPPSWISDFRLHQAVSALSPFGSRTQTISGSLCNFVAISSRSGDMRISIAFLKWHPITSGFAAAILNLCHFRASVDIGINIFVFLDRENLGKPLKFRCYLV